MTLDEFQQYIDLYGTDFASWPEALRNHAEHAYPFSAEMQQVLKTAQTFEARLRTIPIDEPNTDLAERILRQARQLPQKTSSWSYVLNFYRTPALAFTFIFCLGFVLGFAVVQKTSVTRTTTQISLTDALYESDGVSP